MIFVPQHRVNILKISSLGEAGACLLRPYDGAHGRSKRRYRLGAPTLSTKFIWFVYSVKEDET